MGSINVPTGKDKVIIHKKSPSLRGCSFPKQSSVKQKWLSDENYPIIKEIASPLAFRLVSGGSARDLSVAGRPRTLPVGHNAC